MRGADMRVRWVRAWWGAGLLGAVAAPAASAALFSQELASSGGPVERVQARFTRAAGGTAGRWPAEAAGGALPAAEAAGGALPARVAEHAGAGGLIEFWSQYAVNLAQAGEEAGGSLAPGHRLDLSPLTAEVMVLDLVRYRIAGTLATAAGALALWNGATVVAEFSPGPNDRFEPSRWQWGRCRTGLSRC